MECTLLKEGGQCSKFTIMQWVYLIMVCCSIYVMHLKIIEWGTEYPLPATILFWFANSKKLPCKDSSLNGLKLICGKQDGIGSTWFQLKAHEQLYFLKKGSQSQSLWLANLLESFLLKLKGKTFWHL